MQDPSADEVQASAPGSLADEYEADRVAVARELHDGPMQLLTAVSLRLQSAVRRGEIPPEVGSRVLGQLDEAAAGLRRLMGRLLGGTRAFAEEVSTEGPDRPHGGHAPTVLVVDDEEVVRAALAEILTSRGFGVRAVASAPEALALVRRGDQPVDLVVTDLTLHGIDGAQLVTELRTIVPGLRAVCMSGYGGPARSGTGLPAGTSFLQKPFGPDELTRAVDAALGTVARPD
jgi:CheY-like chemotaxis protein